MLEHGLIEYCAPTLAGIKSANLFNYHFSSKDYAVQELNDLNQKLNEKGVYVEALLWKVYCNEVETKKLFEKMQKCTKIYLQVFAEGRTISKMTVCA